LLRAALLVIVLSTALAVGAGASYVWLSQTHAWHFIATHELELAGATALTACLTLLNMGLRWLRWTFLLRRFHARVSTRETFYLFFSTAAIVTPFYLGELLRGAAIARRYRALTSVVLWVWLVERCSDVAALLVLWGLAAQHPAYLAAGAAILLSAPWLLASLTLRLPDASKVHTGQLSPWFTVAASACLSIVAWTLPVLGLLAILLILGAPGSVAMAGSVFARGTLIGGLTGSPGGLGTTGNAMIVDLIRDGLSPATASASVFALRFGTQWFAVALGIVLATVWRRQLLQLWRTSGCVQQHFDALASTYAHDIPEHYRAYILERKIGAMLSELPAAHSGVRGLDLGCGQGWYASELARRGYTMYGVDPSRGQIAQAAQHCRESQTQVELATYDGVTLPFPDASFDFAYSVNVLHHVPTPDAQRALLAEVMRVLKPGGRFLLHEMNVENVLFRGYVSYVFPLLKSIDEGTELWIRPKHLPDVPGGTWQHQISYFTFVPEFLPEIILRAFRPVERWLEASPLRKYSAHYMATLTRELSRSTFNR
jgi:ubiquinone/menaquinone biosynthesis C-methylase UbiE